MLLLAIAVGSALFALVTEMEFPFPAGNEGATSSPTPLLANGTLRVHYVDVGQGDAVVWELPGGGVIVYDCGPAAATPDDNPLVRHLRDAMGLKPGATIHALVASHGHLDHIGGCDEVFDLYHVLHVYDTWYEGEDAPKSYQRFKAKVEAEGATLHRMASSGAPGADTFGIGTALTLPTAAREAGAEARILWPGAYQGSDWDDIARNSIVVRLTFGATSACFQGDIETREEANLAARPMEDGCTVYLAGHHGSRHASSEAWLARMSPSVAVVSFGENSYGHPTSEALCRVQQAGATLYATHRSGGVSVELDGVDARVVRGDAETRDYCAAGASYWA